MRHHLFEDFSDITAEGDLVSHTRLFLARYSGWFEVHLKNDDFPAQNLSALAEQSDSIHLYPVNEI